MAKITLTVIADTQKAQGTIDALKKHIDSTFGKPLEIKVAASGLDDIVSKLQKASAAEAKAAEAAAKLANAEARKINAQTKAAESAAKLERAQKKQAETAQATAQATEKLVYNSEQLARKFMETAQSNDYLEKKLHDLYQAFLQESGIVNSGTQALVLFADSTSLVVQNATATETAIRRLAGAYLELAAAAQGGGGYGMPSSAANYISAAGSLANRGTTGGWTNGIPYGQYTNPYSQVNWQRYLPYDYVPNWTYGGQAPIDVDFIETTGTVVNRAAGSFVNLGDSARAAWAKLREGTPIADALGDSIGNIIVKITTWQVVNGIVAGIKRSFTDALDTMKAVDSELVTVRKVTGFTADEMKRVEEQAYKTASAYGVAADAYLESVAAFARAGYKEQSEDLAELSTKTQIVGDTTAEVANQFLLSVDAAYKYKGSIEELSKVLDGANELDNKYATSIEKIADGMGIVAPVAAQMNVSIDELAAAIGTITAVTQRSGSEAARALRALFLNIAGDTKTEIDEGVTWTTGEIEGLRDVIKLYAKDAYDAAQATGSVIDPMEAMEGLAKSMQDGLLTEQKLIEMVSDIGGKLRTSQLLAIIQNWDMYQSMLTDYAGAIGSADKEVENALDSWERKTAQLDNAFTEFISHIVDTEWIKSAIDALTGFINILDSGIGKIAAMSVAFLALGKTAGLIANFVDGSKVLQTLFWGLTNGALGFKTAMAGLTQTMLASPLFWAVGLAAVIYGAVEAYDALTVTAEEHAEAMEEANREYEDAMDNLASLNGKLEDNIKLILQSNEAGKDDSYLQRLFNENEQLREQIELELIRARNAKARAAEEAVGAATARNYISLFGGSGLSLLQSVKGGLDFGIANMEVGGKAYEQLAEYVDKLIEYRDTVQSAKDAGVELTREQGQFLETANNLISLYVKQIGVSEDIKGATEDIIRRQQTLTTVSLALSKALESGIDDYDALSGKVTPLANAYRELSENGEISAETLRSLAEVYPELNSTTAATADVLETYINKVLAASGYTFDFGTKVKDAKISFEALNIVLKDQVTIYNELKAALEPAYAALAELDEEGAISESTMKALIEAHPELQGAIQVTTDGFVIERQAIEDVINAQLIEYQTIYNNAKNAAQNLLEAEGIKVSAINATTDAIKNQLKALQAMYFVRATEAVANGEDPSHYAAASEAAAIAWKELDAAESNLTNATNIAPVFIPKSSGVTSGSSGSSAGADKDPELERLKEAVALEKQRLSFLETSNASEEEQIAKMREVQDALHAQADYMRSIGASEKDILALSTEWWQYQNKIDKLLEDAEKKAQEAAEAEAKALREGIASTLEGITEELEKQAELATSPLQEELDALKAAHDLRKEDTEEAEKLLAVEKARIALENAERERNVRVYNAKTGQWEWVANAQTVASARENLTAAQKALDDFYAENAYNAKVKALEERIENTSSAFKELIKAITDAAKAVRDGSMTGDAAYAGIGAAMEGIDPIYRQGLAGALIGRMKANSAAWHDAGPDERAELEAQNLAIGTSLGWHRGADGVWYDTVGSRAYDRWTDADVVSPLGFGSAMAGTGYDAMLRSMGIVTSAGGAGGGYAGGSGGTSIGEQHNGDVYQIGGVTLTEGQARGMTVFDLVQMAGGLALHS